MIGDDIKDIVGHPLIISFLFLVCMMFFGSVLIRGIDMFSEKRSYEQDTINLYPLDMNRTLQKEICMESMTRWYCKRLGWNTSYNNGWACVRGNMTKPVYDMTTICKQNISETMLP